MSWEEDIKREARIHKGDLDVYEPSTHHDQKFLMKLANKFKKLINIVPYLVKVFIVTIIVFVLSVWAWNSWIRKDRHEITLKEKIINIVTLKK